MFLDLKYGVHINSKFTLCILSSLFFRDPHLVCQYSRGCVQPVQNWERMGAKGSCHGTHEHCEWFSVNFIILEWQGERQQCKLIVQDVKGEEMKEGKESGRERGKQVVGEVKRGEGHDICKGWGQGGEFVLV
jgi:hypothetical protein